MKFTKMLAGTIATLIAMPTLHALEPVGSNPRILASASKTPIRLQLARETGGWCSVSDGYTLALVDATGSAKQTPFVVPGGSVFVLTDIAWRAEQSTLPIDATSIGYLHIIPSAELFRAGNEEFMIQNNRAVPRVMAGETSLATGQAFLPSTRLCVTASVAAPGGAVGAAKASFVQASGYVIQQ